MSSGSHTGGGGGYSHIRHMGMCCPNGLLFHQKSLDRGPILVKKILTRGSHLKKNCEKIVKSTVFEAENPMEVTYDSGGGYLNYFLTECVARGLKPQPICEDFLLKKRLNSFFLKFSQIKTHFLMMCFQN